MSLLDLIPLPYRILTGVALVGSLLGFTWYKGYHYGHAKSEVEIANFNSKLSAQAAQLQEDQVRFGQLIATNYLLKADSLHSRTVKYVEVTKEVPGPIVTVHDTVTRVELPIGWVYTHDASAGGYDADSAGYSNAATSGLTPNNALRYIVSNYGTCNENAEKLRSLQEWIRQTRFSIDSVNRHR